MRDGPVPERDTQAWPAEGDAGGTLKTGYCRRDLQEVHFTLTDDRTARMEHGYMRPTRLEPLRKDTFQTTYSRALSQGPEESNLRPGARGNPPLARALFTESLILAQDERWRRA